MRYDAQQFYLKSRNEMDLAFKEVPEAITNTSAVAEMCDVKLPFGEDHYPVYERPIETESDPHAEDHRNLTGASTSTSKVRTKFSSAMVRSPSR